MNPQFVFGKAQRHRLFDAALMPKFHKMGVLLSVFTLPRVYSTAVCAYSQVSGANDGPKRSQKVTYISPHSASRLLVSSVNSLVSMYTTRCTRSAAIVVVEDRA